MIITIGRECGCGADEIGKMLSEKYMLPFYARSELLDYAKESGLYDKFPYFFWRGSDRFSNEFFRRKCNGTCSEYA